MENSPAAALITPGHLARRALFGFIITFIIARIVVLLIMSRQMPNLYFFMNGTHVHHLNYGIFLLAAVAGYLLFSERTARNCKFAALGYGIAMALTFDEFGMWLHLGGSYWQRASVDAIIIVAECHLVRTRMIDTLCTVCITTADRKWHMDSICFRQRSNGGWT